MGNFVKYYRELQSAKEKEYDEMIKLRSIYGISPERTPKDHLYQRPSHLSKHTYTLRDSSDVIKTKMKPTSEEMRARSESRSNIGAFNKALK